MTTAHLYNKARLSFVSDGSDTDLAKERAVLDEKLQMLDQEIAQQVSYAFF